MMMIGNERRRKFLKRILSIHSRENSGFFAMFVSTGIAGKKLKFFASLFWPPTVNVPRCPEMVSEMFQKGLKPSFFKCLKCL